MNRRLLVASLFATLLAGCQLSDKTEGPVAACMDVGSACTENRACCSYGCVQGFCMANPEHGGQCRTSDDCADGACRNGRCDHEAVCRLESDVCTWDGQCCTETCNAAGKCVVNGAPVVRVISNANAEGKLATGRDIVFNAGGSTDPDGDYLVYGWQVVRVPTLDSVSCVEGSASSSCTISSPVVGAYRAVVTVTDGKVVVPPQGTIDVEVVNLPPIVQTLTASDTTPSRNVAFTVSASVVDPDGDLVTCSWTRTAPGGTPQPIADATSCSSLSVTADVEGAWAFTIQPDDGVANAPVTGAVNVTVINDAPVVTAGVDRAGNLGAPGTTAPEIAVAAIGTDRNDDPITYTWFLDPPLPEGSALTELTVSSGATARFTPDVAGTYHLRVRASDAPAGDATEDVVDVKVDRFVRDLDLLAVDAEHAWQVGHVVLVGAHPTVANRGALWVLDLATESLGAPVQLDAPPTVVGVAADGSVAVAANDLQYWIVNLAAVPPTVSGPHAHTISVGDVVVTGVEPKSRAFLFSRSSPFQNLGIIDLGAPGTLTTSATYGIAGALDPAGNRLYTVDTSYVRRYLLANSGALTPAGDTTSTPRSTGCARIWSSRKTQSHAFTGCGEIVPVPSGTTGLTINGDLGYGVRSLDTAVDGSGLFADATGAVRRFNTGLEVTTAAEPLPVWSDAGVGHATSAAWVFTHGTSSWAIVTANGASGGRNGLVTLP
jgi:hypothetical protein